MGTLTGSTERIMPSSRFAAGMASGIGSFSAEVDAFLSGGWQGQAAEAFQDWVENATKAQQALSAMAELLSQSAQEYQGHEDGNQALLEKAAASQVRANF